MTEQYQAASAFTDVDRFCTKFARKKADLHCFQRKLWWIVLCEKMLFVSAETVGLRSEMDGATYGGTE